MNKYSSASQIEASAAAADQWAGARSSYEVDESIPIALVQAREGIMRLFRPILRQHGLTDLQWRVLLGVRSSGEIEVARLARMSCLLAPSLSRVLKDLIQRGLLQRRAPASDQRRSLISLSEEGRALMGRVFPPVLDGYDEVKRRYGPEKLELLREMLVEFGDVMGKKG